MTNRKRFFLNGLLLTAVGIAIRSVSLIFNAFITHSIGAEGVGLFTLISTVYSFAVTFATSGISLTVTRLVSAKIGEGKECEVRGMLRSAVAYSLIFSVFATAVLFFGAEYFAVAVLSDKRCIAPLRILSLSLVPIALSSVFSGYFIGVKRVSRNAAVRVLGQIFEIGITAFLISTFARLGVEEGITALAVSMTLTELAVFLVALVEFIIDKRRNLPSDKCRGSHFSSVSSMALPLALSAYIRSALLSLEHILIPRRLKKYGQSNKEALSSYGVLHGMALPILLYPMATLSSYAGLLVPEFSEGLARGERSRMDRIASEALNTTLIYAIASAVMVYIFSEDIGYTVYGSYEAGKYIGLMAPVIPIMYLDHVADSMLKGIGEHVYSMWVNISDSLLSVFLVWILIPRLGIAGYGIVIVVMEGYNFLLSILRLRSRISFKLSFFSSAVLPLSASLLSALISKRLFSFGGRFTPPIWLFLKLVFAVSVFIAMYLFFGLIKGKRKKPSPKNEEG